MPRVAVVHDYFTQQGGAERVAEHFSLMFPDADVFTTVALPGKTPPTIDPSRLRTSWLQRLPRVQSLYRLYFPLYPFGVQSLQLPDYDVIISSSSGYAKGISTRSDALHICYCHTPMRWVWRYQDYAARENFSAVKRALLPLMIGGLKLWDIHAARQPDQYVANSQVVADRIRECYGREAVVIPPPIDVDRFTISEKTGDYYLVLARLVPYKRIDLAVRACNLLGARLVVIGDGPDRQNLEALAGPTVEFTGRLSDAETSRLASQCRALLFPGEEDFGMVPLELAAAGRPTVAFRAGGATETVIDGVTGVFFDEQEPTSLAAAIERLESISWNPAALRNHALAFDVNNFRLRFQQLLESLGAKVYVDGIHPSQALRPALSAPLVALHARAATG